MLIVFQGNSGFSNCQNSDGSSSTFTWESDRITGVYSSNSCNTATDGLTCCEEYESGRDENGQWFYNSEKIGDGCKEKEEAPTDK